MAERINPFHKKVYAPFPHQANMRFQKIKGTPKGAFEKMGVS